MTDHPSRRLSNLITHRVAALVADCHYAARRSVELNLTPRQGKTARPTGQLAPEGKR
jgi:hypothetical protein